MLEFLSLPDVEPWFMFELPGKAGPSFDIIILLLYALALPANGCFALNLGRSNMDI